MSDAVLPDRGSGADAVRRRVPIEQTFCDWCLDEIRSPSTYGRLREAGFTGVEMAGPERWDEVNAAGLELVNIAVSAMEWGLNDHREHDAILLEIQESIDVAAGRGIGQLIVFSGNRRGISDADGVANCVRGLESLAPVAEASGITLLFEVLNSLGGHADYHADHSAFGFEVVRRVGSPAVRVLYDIFHMHRMGEDVMGDISSNVDLIGHMHIAGAPARDFPGDLQEIDYRSLVECALGAGYHGRWGHEFHATTGGPGLEQELVDACTLFRDYGHRR